MSRITVSRVSGYSGGILVRPELLQSYKMAVKQFRVYAISMSEVPCPNPYAIGAVIPGQPLCKHLESRQHYVWKSFAAVWCVVV